MALAGVNGTMRTNASCVLIRFRVSANQIRIIETGRAQDSESWTLEFKLHVNSTAEYPDLPAGDWFCRINAYFCWYRSATISVTGSTEIVPPSSVTAPQTGNLAYFIISGQTFHDRGNVFWGTDWCHPTAEWLSKSELKSRAIPKNDISDIQKYRSAWTYLLADQETIEAELIFPVPPKGNSSLTSRLWDGYTAKYHTDCVLYNRDGKEFPAHRFILASGSSVFAAMFELDMQEKRSGVCKIDDIDGNILEILLEFLYTDRADSGRIKDIVEEVYVVADKYAVAELCAACENIMGNSLSAKTALAYLNFAAARGLDKLKMQIIKFLNENPTEI